MATASQPAAEPAAGHRPLGIEAGLPPAWVEWVARNLLRGIAVEQLVRVLQSRGFDEHRAAEAVEAVAAHPIFAGARPGARRLRTIAAMLDVRTELARRSGAPSIDVRSGLSAEAFHRDYWTANRPVVITDLVEQWPAYRKWTPDYLIAQFGDRPVKVQGNRKTEPVYEVFLKGHTVEMPFGEFLKLAASGDSSNEYYLTANDRVLEDPLFGGLLDDFFPFPHLFTPDNRERKQFLWIGSGGVVSPLHRDRLNVFMTQVAGRKRIKMVDALQTHRMYNFESFFSEVDVENPDLARFPDFAEARIYEHELEAGQALFIPVGWWHHVRALEFSINVSMTNFVFDNDFEAIYDRGWPLK